MMDFLLWNQFITYNPKPFSNFSCAQVLLVVFETASGGLGLKLLSGQAAAYVSLVNFHLTAVADAPLTGMLLQPGAVATAASLLLPPAAAASCSTAAAAATTTTVASVLPAASWALRCLESIYGRPGTFVVPATALAATLEAVAALLQNPLTQAVAAAAAAGGGGGEGSIYGKSRDGGGVGGFGEGFSDAVAVYGSACGLLVSLLRQRKQQLRRLMSPLVVACRLLLLLLLHWDRGLRLSLGQHITSRRHNQELTSGRDVAAAEAAGATAGGGFRGSYGVQWAVGDVVRAAEQLSRVYEAVAGAGDLLGRYCHHIVADYIVHMASEPAVGLYAIAAAAARLGGGENGNGSNSSSSSSTRGRLDVVDVAGGDVDGSSSSMGRGCSSEVVAVVQRGAYALFGVLAPGEVQHVHRVVGQGPLGQRRREAFSDFRKGYEREFKYSGKV
jgi:hypothetical protein